MRERDKKTQNFKKKNTLSFTSQLHPATAALPGRPHNQPPSQRCIIWHLPIDVAPVLGQLTEKNVKFSLQLPHFPRQISIFVSPSTRQIKGPARFSAVSQRYATKRQKKNENHPVRDESVQCSLAQTHSCAKRCILCFFLVCFFF